MMRGGLPPRKLDRLAMFPWTNTIWNRARAVSTQMKIEPGDDSTLN